MDMKNPEKARDRSHGRRAGVGSRQRASECIAKIKIRFSNPEPETQSPFSPLRHATDSLKAEKVFMEPRYAPSSSRSGVTAIR